MFHAFTGTNVSYICCNPIRFIGYTSKEPGSYDEVMNCSSKKELLLQKFGALENYVKVDILDSTPSSVKNTCLENALQ